jgi:hypothetical protein
MRRKSVETVVGNKIHSLARRLVEPRRASGLEGYVLDQIYRFERCEDGKGRYCRVYPGGSFPDYYETCGEHVFAHYFEPVEIQEAATEQNEIA